MMEIDTNNTMQSTMTICDLEIVAKNIVSKINVYMKTIP